MLPLPTRFVGLILAFAPLFVHRSWQHGQLCAHLAYFVSAYNFARRLKNLRGLTPY